MKSTVLFVATIFFCLTHCGCARKAPSSAPASLGAKVDGKTWLTPFATNKFWGLDQGGSVQFQPMDGGSLLFWSDTAACSGRSFSQRRSDAPVTVTQGDCTFFYHAADFPNGLASDKQVKVAYEITGEVHSGQVTVDDKRYDLANGSLFLVSGLGGKLRVKQLNRDLSKLRETLTNPKFDSATLIAFGKNDPEIKPFFSQTANHE